MRDHDPIPPTLSWLTQEVTHVWAWCNRCHHNGTVPLDMLIAQLGPDLPFPSVHGRLRCHACGSKDIHARPEWPSLRVTTGHGPSRTVADDPADLSDVLELQP